MKRVTGESDPKCQTGRRKRHQNQKKQAVAMWCLSSEKSQGAIQRLEGKIFRAVLYKLRGIKWKTRQETSDPNREQLLEMLGQYFKEEVSSAECCDFSESATTMTEESTTTIQLRLHQQILKRSNYKLENQMQPQFPWIASCVFSAGMITAPRVNHWIRSCELFWKVTR